MLYRYFRIFCWLLILPLKGISQTTIWSSPEVEQMYAQAKDYLSKGGIKQSIVLLQQVIQLEPNVMILHRDLAYCYNLVGDHAEAYSTIEPIINSGRADEQSYYIAGSALNAMGDKKKAKKTFDKGIKIYPHSGMLFCELGKYYSDNNDLEYALRSWLEGIEGDPAYHVNYYEAAKAYAGTDQPLWTILYGEIFINMEKETVRSTDARRLVMLAYTKLFNTIGTGYVPKYGGGSTTAAPKKQDFEKAAMDLFLQLAPVMSDGITTDNLIMLRTRFVMDWMANYAAKFPFSLFTYHDRLLRDGQFDAYNQWLFGAAENQALFKSWTQFNPNAIPGINAWMQQNRYYPTASDFYNDKEVGKLFTKKKK